MMPTRLVHPIRNWRKMDQDERQLIRDIAVVVIPFLLLLLAAIAVLMATFTQPLRIAAPFVFSARSYEPVQREVCPGDTLEWPVAFTIQRAPVMVISVRSIWDVDANQTVALPPGEAVQGALMFTNYTETTHVDRSVSIPVPNLEPGEYQIRSAVQEFNSQAAAYAVGFRVKDDCP
jgi:hypothetical protein